MGASCSCVSRAATWASAAAFVAAVLRSAAWRAIAASTAADFSRSFAVGVNGRRMSVLLLPLEVLDGCVRVVGVGAHVEQLAPVLLRVHALVRAHRMSSL